LKFLRCMQGSRLPHPRLEIFTNIGHSVLGIKKNPVQTGEKLYTKSYKIYDEGENCCPNIPVVILMFLVF
jgi:hypothetical protein